MIQTTVENLSRYESLNPLFPAAFAALKALAAEAFTKGRHEVDGDRIYVNAAEYDTKPVSDSCMEHHKRYIDVMWMVSGEEIIGTCPVSQLEAITMPYSEKDDVCLAKLPGRYTELKIKAGDVVILFPEDAHAPCMQLDGVSAVRKLIAKVEVTA
jgi:YhcH/YjgK/YiaL family protein